MINGEAASEMINSKAGLVYNSGDYKSLAKLILKLNNMSRKRENENGRKWHFLL